MRKDVDRDMDPDMGVGMPAGTGSDLTGHESSVASRSVVIPSLRAPNIEALLGPCPDWPDLN